MTAEEERIHDIKVVVQFTTCPFIIPIQALALFVSLPPSLREPIPPVTDNSPLQRIP